MTVKCTFFSNIFDLSSSYRLDNAISDELRFLDNFKTGSNVSECTHELIEISFLMSNPNTIIFQISHENVARIRCIRYCEKML